MLTMRSKICKLIANILPNRVVFWVLIRAFSESSTTTFSHVERDKISFDMILEHYGDKIK